MFTWWESDDFRPIWRRSPSTTTGVGKCVLSHGCTVSVLMYFESSFYILSIPKGNSTTFMKKNLSRKLKVTGWNHGAEQNQCLRDHGNQYADSWIIFTKDAGKREAGGREGGPPGFGRTVSYIENTIFSSKIPENWWKLYCLKQRCTKNSVLENLGKLTQCTRSLAM